MGNLGPPLLSNGVSLVERGKAPAPPLTDQNFLDFLENMLKSHFGPLQRPHPENVLYEDVNRRTIEIP